MRSRAISWAFGLFFAALAANSAMAQDDWQPRERVEQGQIQPLDRILPEIRRTHPGTFYDAEGPFPGADGGMHYRLKWMTPEGRIIWFDTDARTGRVLGTGGGSRDFAPGDNFERRQPDQQFDNDQRRYRDRDNDGRDRFDNSSQGNPFGNERDREPGGSDDERGHGSWNGGWGGGDWGHGDWGGRHGGHGGHGGF